MVEQPVRILIVASEFPPGPGGIGTHAYQLALQLTKRHCRVLVCAPQAYVSEAEVQAFNRSVPFDITTLRMLRPYPVKVLDRLLSTAQAAHRFSPDVVVSTGDPAAYLALTIAKALNVPWVAVEHGRIPASLEGRLKRWTFSAAEAVVAVSIYSMQRLLEMGVRPRSALVIHNGADAERFRKLSGAEIAAARERLKLVDRRVLLTVGNVSERKAQDLVIRALPAIRRFIPNVLYVMVGLPSKRGDFRRLAQELGVIDQVRFAGRVDESELLGYLNVSELFLMPSRHTAHGHEGFGIAVVEAALCGRTAVVSKNSGITEAIVDGRTGIAVPPDKVQELADAIVRIMSDEGLRRSLERAAFERALREQTWTHAAGRYHELIDTLASRPRRASVLQYRTSRA